MIHKALIEGLQSLKHHCETENDSYYTKVVDEAINALKQKEGKVIKMKSYLYHDEASGEEFIVEALNKEEAQRTAEMYFEAPKLDSEISDLEAEMLGLDTY